MSLLINFSTLKVLLKFVLDKFIHTDLFYAN
jgi:hypothetical protein